MTSAPVTISVSTMNVRWVSRAMSPKRMVIIERIRATPSTTQSAGVFQLSRSRSALSASSRIARKIPSRTRRAPGLRQTSAIG